MVEFCEFVIYGINIIKLLSSEKNVYDFYQYLINNIQVSNNIISEI